MSNYKTIWITNDGRKINIKDLEDSHLMNIIKYLRKREAYFKDQAFMSGNMLAMTLQGEMAIATIENDLARLDDMDEEEFLSTYIPCYTTLLKEAIKRKLMKGGE